MSGIEETRIDLSPLSLTDASGLFLIRGDEEAMRHWDWPPDKTLDETRHAAEQMLRSSWLVPRRFQNRALATTICTSPSVPL